LGFIHMPLSLKAIPPGDYGAYHALINDPLISYNSGSIPHPVDYEFARKRLEDRAQSERSLGGIIQRGAYVQGRLVGDASIFINKDGEIEIGYCVAKDQRGKGYATEMARQLVKLARDYGHYGPIVAGYAKDNPVSGKILEKLGFEKTGETTDTSAGREGLSAYWRMALPAVDDTRAETTLRPMSVADIPAIFALQHDREGAALAGVEGDFVSEEMFRDRMTALMSEEAEAPTVFTIMVNGEVAGTISRTPGSSGKILVSYWLDRKFWGAGIATAAFAQMLMEAPKKLVGEPMFAAVINGNRASVRVLEKFGFIPFKRREFMSAAHGELKQQTLFRR